MKRGRPLFSLLLLLAAQILASCEAKPQGHFENAFFKIPKREDFTFVGHHERSDMSCVRMTSESSGFDLNLCGFEGADSSAALAMAESLVTAHVGNAKPAQSRPLGKLGSYPSTGRLDTFEDGNRSEEGRRWVSVNSVAKADRYFFQVMRLNNRTFDEDVFNTMQPWVQSWILKD